MGDIKTGNDITGRSSVNGKNEGTQDRALGYSIGSEKASEKLLPSLTFCLQFEREDLIRLNTVFLKLFTRLHGC